MIWTLLSLLWSQWALVAGVVLFAAYKWSTASYDFFEKKNVPYEKPVPLLGSFARLLLQKESMFGMLKRLYRKNKGKKFFGVFEMRTPILIVQSPELIKQIAVKDFDHFLNHRVVVSNGSSPLFANSLFSLQNQKWKDMRATLSPAFTGSKMRLMFEFVDECGRDVNQYMRNEIKNNRNYEVELKDLFTRFTNDVIASCAFGLKMNSLQEKDHEFYEMSRKATNFSGWVAFKFFLISNFPKVTQLLKLQLFDEAFANYFNKLVLDTMAQRASQGIVRQDMINLLMEARKGTLQASDLGQVDSHDGFATVQESAVGQSKVTRNWTDVDIVAQCILFFIGGFETSSVLMCFCAHELMENPDVQKKLIEEIDQTREELGGKPLTYEVLQKLKYLDMVISETLRKWPPGIATDRVCNRPCVLGDMSGEHVKMNPGDVLQMNISGLHHDPEYFPNPDKFDPERFSDDNKNNIKPFTYIPFGVGPRNCIGSRFALMESKAIIYHLLSEFTFEASPKTSIPLKLSTTGFQLQAKNGFWLNIKPRN